MTPLNNDIVDETDFAILFSVKQHDLPPWKNRLHGWIVEHEDDLPITGGVSVQTIGRRVDNLVKNDYLETVIVSPETIKRDLIIAFKLTEKGKNTIDTTREHLLSRMVRNHLFNDDRIEIQNDCIATLLADRYGWEDDTVNSMNERYGTAELSAFLTMIYVEEHTDGMLDGMSEQIIRELAGTSEEIQSAQNIDPSLTQSS